MVIDQIYALCDPDTGDVRYIGKSKNPKARYENHIAHNRGYPVSRWIFKLKSQGKKPVLKILASALCLDGWKELEPLMIKQYMDDGSELLNVSRGGIDDRFPSMVPVGRQEYSDEQMKRIKSIRTAMILDLKKGRVKDEVKEKLRIAAEKRPDLFKAFLRYL